MSNSPQRKSLYIPLLILLFLILLSIGIGLANYFFQSSPAISPADEISSNQLYTAHQLWGDNSPSLTFTTAFPEVSQPSPFIDLSPAELITLVDPTQIRTGVVFFGSASCEPSAIAASALRQAALETGLEKIYFLDPTTQDHQQLLANLAPVSQYLPLDENGRPDLLLPAVFFIRDGFVVGVHYGTIDDQLANPSDVIISLTQLYQSLAQKTQDQSWRISLTEAVVASSSPHQCAF